MLRSLFLLAAIALSTGCSVVPDDIDLPDDTNLVSYNRAVTGGDRPLDGAGLLLGWKINPRKPSSKLLISR